MFYKIIKTQASSDKLTSYSLFRRDAKEDLLTSDTYGIIAANFDGCITIDDVATDLSVAEKLLMDLTDNSVIVSKLHEYIIDFLSKL